MHLNHILNPSILQFWHKFAAISTRICKRWAPLQALLRHPWWLWTCQRGDLRKLWRLDGARSVHLKLILGFSNFVVHIILTLQISWLDVPIAPGLPQVLLILWFLDLNREPLLWLFLLIGINNALGEVLHRGFRARVSIHRRIIVTVPVKTVDSSVYSGFDVLQIQLFQRRRRQRPSQLWWLNGRRLPLLISFEIKSPELEGFSRVLPLFYCLLLELKVFPSRRKRRVFLLLDWRHGLSVRFVLGILALLFRWIFVCILNVFCLFQAIFDVSFGCIFTKLA